MNKQAKLIIGALAAVTVVLAVALVAVATDDEDQHGTSQGDAYMGMMQSMGNMNSAAMLQNMRAVLGEDGYQRMMAHFRDHRSGMMASNAAVDDMMHRMMDGMMERMPADSDGMMPRMGMGSAAGTVTPTARP